MPKLAMINTVCSGSHGRIMQDLRGAAEADGFQTLIAYGRGADCGGLTYRIGNQRDILWHVGMTRALDRHAQASRHATRKLIAQLEAWKPDLVHLHNVHGYFLHAQTLFDYLKEAGLPVLWTLHDCWAFTGHCSHYVRANCSRWQDGCHDCPLKREYPASYGLDASRANWQWKRDAFGSLSRLHIAAPSHWLDAQVAASFLGAFGRTVIPNGVDLSLFMPGNPEGVRAAHGVQPGQAMLLAVASPFDARKGFEDVIQLAALCKDQARVVMVGLTEKQRAQLPAYITGACRTDGPEALVALYQAADCLINPTYEDTYPTVTMEAMACGTPVAGYTAGGAKEQLSAPCGTGVAVGDVQALSQAALALAGQRDRLRNPCREYAITHFDRRNAISAYLSQYHTMTGVE